MASLDFILNKYNISNKESSPIGLYCKRVDILPKLFKRLGFKLGAEIGVFKGYNSERICKSVPELKLYCIDSWQERNKCIYGKTPNMMEKIYHCAKRRLTSLPNCEIIRGWSMEVVKQFEDESLDFVYIDASHDYKSVIEDIAKWSKKVRKDGLVMGHDYRYYWETNIKELTKDNFKVKEAVDAWVKEKKIAPLFFTSKDHLPSWFYVK